MRHPCIKAHPARRGRLLASSASQSCSHSTRFFALGVAISRRERHVAGPSAHHSCHCCLVSSALRAALRCAASVEVPFPARTRAVLLAHACVFEKSACSSKCHSCYKLASRIQSLLEQYHPPASFTAHMWPASNLCAAAACSRAYIAWLARALHSPHLGFHAYLPASFNMYVYTRSASAPPDVLTPEQDRLFLPGACTQAHICAAVSVPPAHPARVAAVAASMLCDGQADCGKSTLRLAPAAAHAAAHCVRCVTLSFASLQVFAAQMLSRRCSRCQHLCAHAACTCVHCEQAGAACAHRPLAIRVPCVSPQHLLVKHVQRRLRHVDGSAYCTWQQRLWQHTARGAACSTLLDCSSAAQGLQWLCRRWRSLTSVTMWSSVGACAGQLQLQSTTAEAASYL
jgi:hypothetical protein